MSNMSYCRFRNTVSDLRDCKEELKLLMTGRPHTMIKDPDEREAREELVLLCLRVAAMFPEAAEQEAPGDAMRSAIAQAEEDSPGQAEEES
jgi:hypothetical protein